MPTSPTGQPSSQPSSRPTSRPTTHLRTKIVIPLEQTIHGVSKATFDADAAAQQAFKNTLSKIVSGLLPNQIAIDSTSSVSRRLRDEVHDARRLTVGTVQVDYTITTYAQDVSDGDDGNAAADSVINSVQAASSDGTFASTLTSEAEEEGSSNLQYILVSSVSLTSAVTVTSEVSPLPTMTPFQCPI